MKNIIIIAIAVIATTKFSYAVETTKEKAIRLYTIAASISVQSTSLNERISAMYPEYAKYVKEHFGITINPNDCIVKTDDIYFELVLDSAASWLGIVCIKYCPTCSAKIRSNYISTWEDIGKFYKADLPNPHADGKCR